VEEVVVTSIFLQTMVLMICYAVTVLATGSTALSLPRKQAYNTVTATTIISLHNKGPV
jgi:hypothetical protein